LNKANPDATRIASETAAQQGHAAAGDPLPVTRTLGR
jgi:hypothetical protein